MKKEHNFSFEQIVSHIESGDLLDIVNHPNKEKFSHQKILIIKIEEYVIAVPFVENDNERFLKVVLIFRGIIHIQCLSLSSMLLTCLMYGLKKDDI